MSVVKNKRSQSKVEFEALFFAFADNIDNLVSHCFYAEPNLIDSNRWFIDARCQTLERLSDDLLYHIKIANSIYPTNLMEYEERRLNMNKAIGICFAILTNLQRIMLRLRVPDDKYVDYIKVTNHMINSLKMWRKSDNKLKTRFK